MSWPNAVEKRNVLRRFEEPRHPLVLRAMLPGDDGGAVDIAVIADLGRTRIALEQKRLRPRAGGAQGTDEKGQNQPTRQATRAGAQSEAASISDSIS